MRLRGLILAVILGVVPVACGESGTEPGAATATTSPTAVPSTVTPTPTPVPPTATPMPVCTPPACGENEVYYCPGECPGGCGVVCATITPDPNAILPPAPTDWAGLAAWLADTYRSQFNNTAVQSALLDAGWQREPADWRTADLTGDRWVEWILLLYPPGAEQEVYTPANLWIINEEGLRYRFYEDPNLAGGVSLSLKVSGTADFTGDGTTELVVNEETCGAHTCFTGLRVIDVVDGAFTNLVEAEAADPASQNGDVIAVSYADIRFADGTGDGVTDVLVHGGAIGSAGAGIVRTYTEVWAWDGSAVTLADTILDPTNYRHHILYEANSRMETGELAAAQDLYERVINDESLQTPAFTLSEAETYADLSQFAAFRLILIDLIQEDSVTAESRLAWLEEMYPDAPATAVAPTLINNWAGEASLPDLCAGVDAGFIAYNAPTGVLADLGYGNPSLEGMDFCPYNDRE